MSCVVPSMRPELLAVPALPQPLSSHKLVQVPLNMNKKEALKSGQNVVDRLSAWLQGCKRRLSKDLLPDPDDPAAGQEGEPQGEPEAALQASSVFFDCLRGPLESARPIGGPAHALAAATAHRVPLAAPCGDRDSLSSDKRLPRAPSVTLGVLVTGSYVGRPLRLLGGAR